MVQKDKYNKAKTELWTKSKLRYYNYKNVAGALSCHRPPPGSHITLQFPCQLVVPDLNTILGGQESGGLPHLWG